MLNFCDFIQVFVFTTNHHLIVCYHFAELKDLRNFPVYNDSLPILINLKEFLQEQKLHSK